MESIFATLPPTTTSDKSLLSDVFEKDSFPGKINLFSKTVFNEEGKPFYSSEVRTVELRCVKGEPLNKEYLNTYGLELYRRSAMKILLGDDHPAIFSRKAGIVQTIDGTGALFLSCQFMNFIMQRKEILISAPMLRKYVEIAKLSRFQKIKEYRYWNSKNQCIDFKGMVEDIVSAEDESVIILQACAHKPTGMDLSRKMWIHLADILKSKRVFTIFDVFNQGLATGDLDCDVWALRYFIDQGFELFACQSFSKSFGLRYDKVGSVCIITNDSRLTDSIISQMFGLITATWLNPPLHGCSIIGSILDDPALLTQWKRNIQLLVNRLLSMRRLIFQRFQLLETPGSWHHITEQVGMFLNTGLTKEQVDYLRTKFHIYVSNDGRINLSALNFLNFEGVATSIHEAITGSPNN